MIELVGDHVSERTSHSFADCGCRRGSRQGMQNKIKKQLRRSVSSLPPSMAPPLIPLRTCHFEVCLMPSNLLPTASTLASRWLLPGSAYQTSTSSTNTISSPSKCTSARRLTHALPYVLPRSRPLAPRPSPPRKRLRHESSVGVRGLCDFDVFVLVHGFDDDGIMCLALLVLSS